MFVLSKKVKKEIYTIQQNLKVFGARVKTFPVGIQQAYDSLVKMVPGGLKRSYYGISYLTPDARVIYFATVMEKFKGEAEKYNYRRYIIEKGEYITVSINDWMSKTDCIKDVFHEIMQDKRIDKRKQVVEWYRNEEEMLCMVKTIST